MASTGEVFPTLGTTTAEAPWSDNAWADPTNIYADDGSTASVTPANFDSGDQTQVLKASGFDFSGIPAGATIDGVICRVNTWYDDGGVYIALMQLLDTARAKVGTNQYAVPAELSNDDTTILTKGGAADLWGNALNLAWVQDADFGIALGFTAKDDNADVFVDYVTLEVYYTEAVADVDMGAASLTATAATLTVTPGAIAVSMGAATATAMAATLTLTAIVALDMGAAIATSAAPSLTVTPGAVAVSMGAAALTSAAPSLVASVVGGPVAVPMGAAVATATAPSLTVTPGAVAVTMNSAIATSAAPSLAVTPGAVAVPMGAAIATGEAPALTVAPGAVAVPMGAAIMTSAAPDLLVVLGGGVVVNMGAAILVAVAGGLLVDNDRWRNQFCRLEDREQPTHAGGCMTRPKRPNT